MDNFVEVEPSICSKVSSYRTYTYFFVGFLVFILLVVVFYYMTRKKPEPIPEYVYNNPFPMRFMPKDSSEKQEVPEKKEHVKKVPEKKTSEDPQPIDREESSDEVHAAQYKKPEKEKAENKPVEEDKPEEFTIYDGDNEDVNSETDVESSFYNSRKTPVLEE